MSNTALLLQDNCQADPATKLKALASCSAKVSQWICQGAADTFKTYRLMCTACGVQLVYPEASFEP